ncbi:MAG: ATP synthase F1 subunit gamma [Bryobacterales bacterium]
MPSLIDLRRRIRSVHNTQQITKAMKMVSAARLRRAQERALEGRPYSKMLREMLGSVIGKLAEDSPVRQHPLLDRREEKRILLVVLAGEKGLCGAFNSNVLRASQAFLAQHSGDKVELEVLGRKARDFYRKRPVEISGQWVGVLTKVEFASAREIAGRIIERFAEREMDAVYLVYNEFKSVMTQKVNLLRLLPIDTAQPEGADAAQTSSVDYIYEQPPEDIFRFLLPKFVEISVYQAMVESAASEHAARMTAMDAATRNAGEVIEKLTLHLNRVRQASITNDLIEVVSGAAALEEA